MNPAKPLCRHTWSQVSTQPVSDKDGLVTTRYEHECPQCGRHKVTVRASRKLPPPVRLKRELEKLIEAAGREKLRFILKDDQGFSNQLNLERISVVPL